MNVTDGAAGQRGSAVDAPAGLESAGRHRLLMPAITVGLTRKRGAELRDP